jgi:adenylate cyclase
MATEDFKRKLTAILSADVKGYSRLMGEDEEATVRTITAHRKVIASVIQKYRGRVVDSIRAKNAELPEERKMEFRIGINLGDVIQEGERIYGDGVNIAARVEGLADPGGICISGSAYEQIENKLASPYGYIGCQQGQKHSKRLLTRKGPPRGGIGQLSQWLLHSLWWQVA